MSHIPQRTTYRAQNMNARHRVEIMFCARLMHVVAVTGVRFDEPAEHEAFIKEAWEAVLEPTNGLYGKEKESLRRRLYRMEELTIIPACEKAFAEKIILIGYHFITELQDRNYLEIPEGSKLRRVTDALLAMIDMDDEVAQIRFVKAQKVARKWLEILQKQGYFI